VAPWLIEDKTELLRIDGNHKTLELLANVLADRLAAPSNSD
jgi:hypothetical protein